jgi:hypothetical protein
MGWHSHNALIFYSGGAQFESCRGHRLSWMGFFVVVVGLSKRMPRDYLDLATDPVFQISIYIITCISDYSGLENRD